ncbi:cytochrome P450 [Flammula alnicola]|nr:cytochrome P450 [Flammula alnicola]
MTVKLSAEDILVYCVPCFLLGLFLFKYSTKKHNLPLPPGPRKLPLIGNLLDVPSKFEWEAFQAWGKEYDSDIIHLNVAGTSIIVLNSLKAAYDLMDKRSSIYSSRPKFTLIKNLMGFSWLLPFLQYGTAWKEQRRFFQRHFRMSTDKIHKTQEIEYSRRLLLQLLDTPDDFFEHIRHAVGGTLHSIAYGTKKKESNDSYINLAEEVMEAIADTAMAASGLIDSMPFLLPILSPFLPGPAFKKSPAQWKKLVYRFRDEPFLKVQKSMADGTVEASFVSRCLEISQEDKLREELIKDIASIIFIGGSSTTKAVLSTFFLAMLCFPEAQTKAQEELDRVVGQGRLPEFSDEPHMPYLSALIKEVHRWNTAGPIGIPHFLEQDDEYNGYFIPGQSIIIGNAWAMLNDEKDYPDPRSFQPERFLKDGQLDTSVRDPSTIVFGFGRRICPGAHIAHSTIWITAASILSTFNISKPLDEKGVVIEPSMEYLSAITFMPLPFKCAITPRHDRAENLIRAHFLLLTKWTKSFACAFQRRWK